MQKYFKLWIYFSCLLNVEIQLSSRRGNYWIQVQLQHTSQLSSALMPLGEVYQEDVGFQHCWKLSGSCTNISNFLDFSPLGVLPTPSKCIVHTHTVVPRRCLVDMVYCRRHEHLRCKSFVGPSQNLNPSIFLFSCCALLNILQSKFQRNHKYQYYEQDPSRNANSKYSNCSSFYLTLHLK